MLDSQRLVSARQQTREELFTQRYERLLAWALQLTNQHRPTAEDLVQDAFIQFVLGHTSLEEIENIDGYLRSMLRYMHLARIGRTSEKIVDRTISIADYDSIDRSWQSIEPSRRMQAREELGQICAYACSRKETSRAGVVLILRFFHNYYPSEIAQVLRTSRHCVDEWQRVARSELKLYMTESGRLRLMSNAVSPALRQAKHSGSDGNLISELRQMIFNSRKGECLRADQLQEFYQTNNTEKLTTAQLGHIVSCRFCLDYVNRLLGLPLLAERYQSDHDEPASSPQDKNGGSSGGGTIDLSSKYKRRLREVSEHKPKELRITVNGSLVSSLKVSGKENELDLKLPPLESVEFVEILSEQGLQLLFLALGKTATNTAQCATIEFSERRRLEIYLRFENGPALQINYDEPLLEDEVAHTRLKLIDDTISVAPDVAGNVNSHNQSSGWFASLLRFLRWPLVTTNKVIEEKQSALPETTPENFFTSRQVSILSVASPVARKRIWRRPGWVAALICMILAIGGFFFFRTRSTPTLTAANLLERATVNEQIQGSQSEQVTHQVIDIQDRRLPDGIISHHRIEIWCNTARGDRAERLFDESNRMIAGTWQKGDGSRTVYHHGAELHPEPATPTAESLLLNPDNIWQLDLSAKEFRQLIANALNSKIEESGDSYIITSGTARTIGASRLLRATLKLNRPELRPIEEALLIERNGEIREYRFVEARFERVSETDVEPAVFNPDGQIIIRDKATPRRGDPVLINSSTLPPLTPLPHRASPELEVDVAYLLNQAKGDRNEQVTLSRTASDLLSVEGVVDTEQRREELIRALAPVSNNPAVKIEIRTTSEALQRATSSSPGTVIVRKPEETANTVAVDTELRDYLSRRDPTLKTTNLLDEAVRSYSSRVVNRGYQALFHAIELKRLMDRFANVDMRTVTPDARSKWLGMVREHGAALERECAALRQDIQPVFFSGVPQVAPEEIAIVSDADLARAVDRVHKLTLISNDAIRAAFTISSQSSNAAKSLQFWRLLASAENLASRIKHFPG